MKSFYAAAMTFLVPAIAAADSSSSAAAAPELDGSMALIALGLVASILAMIRERRRH